MVYVIDNDESVRKGLQSLFRSVHLAVETFSSAREFLSAPRRERNACILIGTRMDGLAISGKNWYHKESVKPEEGGSP